VKGTSKHCGAHDGMARHLHLLEVYLLALRRGDSERNQYEHEVLMKELKALDSALEGLVCSPEVYTDLGTAGTEERQLSIIPKHL
jgi:hypothetical protein